MLLPIDCPLLDPRELDHLLTGVPEHYVGDRPRPPRRPGRTRWSWRPRARSARPSARAAAPATSPRPATQAFPSESRSWPRSASTSTLRPTSSPSPASWRPTPAAPGEPRRRLGYERRGRELRVIPVAGLPEVTEGMAIGELIAARAELAGGDVVVVSQKVVSKAEGRVRRLSSVLPGARGAPPRRCPRQGAGAGRADPRGEQRGAARRARRADRRDAPRLRLRQRRHRQLQPARGRHRLPAARGPRRLGAAHPQPRSSAAAGATVAVVVSDSFGRAWRLGQAEVAIGCAGLAPLDDWRGRARRRRPRAGGDRDRRRRRGRGGGRPGPRQGKRRAGGDRPRPRPLRHRGATAPAPWPSAAPATRTSSANPR